MHALVTANVKSVLEGINGQPSYNTTVAQVEEVRTIINIDVANYVLLQEKRVEYVQDYQHTNQVIYEYAIAFFSGANDEGTNNPYTYANRNIVADITKALMVDRTRNGQAINTNIVDSGPDLFVDPATDLILPCTTVAIEVLAHVNADNPYQLA